MAYTNYTTKTEVRDLTGLTDAQITNTNLEAAIDEATRELNQKINERIQDEEIDRISSNKKNTIDGSNTTFYTEKTPIANKEDSVVDGSDVYAYTINDDTGARTEYTVSSVDDNRLGKLTLSSAPSSNETLYFTYYISPLDESDPHFLISKACRELSAAKAYKRTKGGDVKSFSLGELDIVRRASKSAKWKSEYNGTIRDILARGLEDSVDTSDIW